MPAPARYLQQCGNLRFLHGVLHRVQRSEKAPPRLVRKLLAPGATDCQDDGHLHAGDLRCIRTQVAPAPNPGEAGADNLRHLLYDTAPDVDSPPAPDPAPRRRPLRHGSRRHHPGCAAASAYEQANSGGLLLQPLRGCEDAHPKGADTSCRGPSSRPGPQTHWRPQSSTTTEPSL